MVICSAPGVASGVAPAAAPVAAAAGAAPAAAAAAPAAGGEENLTPIPSPLVGTFYRASSPDADPFVQVGSRVNKDTVVCIIEAMKVMNEIKAEKAGIIREICIENAETVEFAQVLFKIEKA